MDNTDIDFQSIKNETTQMIEELVNSGNKDLETRKLIYDLKRFIEKIDNLEQELIHIPLAKYVDIRNRFPGSPRR